MVNEWALETRFQADSGAVEVCGERRSFLSQIVWIGTTANLDVVLYREIEKWI